MIHRLAILAVFASAIPATAETLTIEVHDGVRLIRCLDMFGAAQCDLITDTDSPYKSCMALDAAGDPIAVTTVQSGITSALFPDLSHTAVMGIACQ